ncbi:MAG: alpha/beta fold hydrolase [Chloroflexi bacterium]|nr:alpha/beta fold hydrolase [Chloroflexota bacterium]
MAEVKVEAPASGEFNVYQAGNGPPVLLLHSMAASWWSWSRSLPLIERHFSVVAPDLLGHGKSEPRRDVVAVEHHAASLEALVAALGLDQGFYLAGAALGSLVAIELTLRHPEWVRGLLLFGTPSFKGQAARSSWLANRCATFVGPDGHAAPMDEATVYARFKHHEPDLVDRFNQERTQAGLWALHDLWAIGSYDTASHAARLQTRTIIAYGGEDPFLPGRDALMAVTPRAEHLLLEGVGHYPSWDAPETAVDLLRRLAGNEIASRERA